MLNHKPYPQAPDTSGEPVLSGLFPGGCFVPCVLRSQAVRCHQHRGSLGEQRVTVCWGWVLVSSIAEIRGIPVLRTPVCCHSLYFSRSVRCQGGLSFVPSRHRSPIPGARALRCRSKGVPRARCLWLQRRASRLARGEQRREASAVPNLKHMQTVMLGFKRPR